MRRDDSTKKLTEDVRWRTIDGSTRRERFHPAREIAAIKNDNRARHTVVTATVVF